jgi:SagB-type dehydrogenase family enzyme
MNKVWLLGIGLITMLTGCQAGGTNIVNTSSPADHSFITLPAPRLTGPVSLEESLNARRSVREFTDEPLSLLEVSQLLWAAQGITSPTGGRTAPSAGGLYPLEIYLVAGTVRNLPAGIYHYVPDGHQLSLISAGDYLQKLSQASLGQKAVAAAAVDLVISSVYDRTTKKYGERGVRYADIEAGHAAQNIVLQAVAIRLGAVTIGAFDDIQVKKLLSLAEVETPLYVIPVGYPAR